MSALGHWESRWPDFKPEEVLNPSGLELFNSRGECLINENAMDYLQKFRRHVRYALKCNYASMRHRGFRNEVENKGVDGKPFSFHMLGLAFDLTASEVDNEVLWRDAINFGWHGVGLYRSWVHVDLRPLMGMPMRRWKNV